MLDSCMLLVMLCVDDRRPRKKDKKKQEEKNRVHDSKNPAQGRSTFAVMRAAMISHA